MCLILFAYRRHPRYPLVLAANRDEFYARPTEPAAFWPEAPQVLAGRDRVGGGSWLGITRGGRLAAVTNYRHPAERGRGKRSRGLLVRDFLLAATPPRTFLQDLADGKDNYAGFNLLVGDLAALGWYSNRNGPPKLLPPGLYGLSNHLLDTPWPKVAGGKDALASLLATDDPAPEDLFAILSDTAVAPEERLPATGIGRERERQLSARFIHIPGYGTRCSTVLLIDRERTVTFVERRFDGAPDRWREVRQSFTLAPAPRHFA